MKLDDFLHTVSDGDCQGWDEEIALLNELHWVQLKELEISISRHGILEPILIGDDGRCWDGHHRVAVAVRLGLDEIPVVHSDGRVP